MFTYYIAVPPVGWARSVEAVDEWGGGVRIVQHSDAENEIAPAVGVREPLEHLVDPGDDVRESVALEPPDQDQPRVCPLLFRPETREGLK